MKTKKQIPYVLFGPIITLLIMLALYAISGIYPFGSNTTAFSDGIAQYVPFLSELADKIKNGGSLLFSWHIGNGVNFWTTFSYYLANPINLISVFFKPNEMDKAYAIITLIKPVFMALTFGIFLKDAYKKNDLSVSIFSVLWALSGFMLGGIFITSWYDSIIWFPLVIMGLKRMMDGKSGWMYSLFLGLAIASNFYIGWMICIFCVIYFIYSFITDDEVGYEGVTGAEETGETEDNQEDGINVFAVFQNSYLLKTFFKFGFSSLLAGGISAIMTIPMFDALGQTGKGVITESDMKVTSVWGILASHIFPAQCTYNVLATNNYIFAFAGIATIILCVAFFFSKGVSIRKKIGNIILLVIMWASIGAYPLYFAWHGFGEPAGIMYRFAFVYSFVLLMIAYEAFTQLEKIPAFAFVVGGLVAGVCAAGIYFDDLMRDEFFSVTLIATIGVFIVFYTVFLLIMAKKTSLKNVLTITLLAVVMIEAVMLNKNHFNTYNLQENLNEYGIVSELTKDIEKTDKVTFVSQKQNFNDMVMYGGLFGYNGLECYSSVSNGAFSRTVVNVGSFGNRLNAQNGAVEQTPVFNFIYPMNYYIDGSGRVTESPFRTKIAEKNGYTLFKNNYTMPFMYTVSPAILDWHSSNYIVAVDCQNGAFKGLTGATENALTYTSYSNFEFVNCKRISFVDALRQEHEANGEVFNESNAEYYEMLEKKMDSFAYEINDVTKSASIKFNITAESDGMMYFYIQTKEFANMTIEINGKTINCRTYGIGEKRPYEIGMVKKGDVATITIGGYLETLENASVKYLAKKDTISAIGFTVDMNMVEAGYKALDAMSDTEMLEFKDTYVKAKVTSYTDGMLYIPTTNDGGWKIFIDGVETEIYDHHSHIIMVPITEGEHTVEMKYCPSGFVAGAVVTGVSAIILVAWIILSKKQTKKMLVEETENVSEE